MIRHQIKYALDILDAPSNFSFSLIFLFIQGPTMKTKHANMVFPV